MSQGTLPFKYEAAKEKTTMTSLELKLKKKGKLLVSVQAVDFGLSVHFQKSILYCIILRSMQFY